MSAGTPEGQKLIALRLNRRELRLWRDAWAMAQAIAAAEEAAGVAPGARVFRPRRGLGGEIVQAQVAARAFGNLRRLMRMECRRLGLPAGAICEAARAAAKLNTTRKSLSREEQARRARELAQGYTAETWAAKLAAKAEARRALAEFGVVRRRAEGKAKRAGRRAAPRVDGWGGLTE